MSWELAWGMAGFSVGLWAGGLAEARCWVTKALTGIRMLRGGRFYEVKDVTNEFHGCHHCDGEGTLFVAGEEETCPFCED
jgi:hypothetical protein